MKATVQIDLFQNRKEKRDGEQPQIGIKAVWLREDTKEVVGELTVVQVLAILEQAKMLILAGVPFEPPDKSVVVVPGQALKDLDKLVVN